MTLPDFLTQNEYGEVFLTGHRVALQHVIRPYWSGASPEQLALELPTISLAHIHKVIAFYLENTADVTAYIAAVDAEIARQMALAPTGPSAAEMRRRFAAEPTLVVVSRPKS